MMNKNKYSERGQALVLIAFAFVALVAFAALAIDGGMVYTARREAQNASDAGSLSGGGAAALSMENNHVYYADFDCDSADVIEAITDAENAALNLMLANDYGAADISVSTECQDYEDTYFQEKYIDITTDIVTETNTSLIHLVYDGPVPNLVDATTRVKPRTPLAYGHAVVGLNPDADCDNAGSGGVKFTGGGGITIEGGGIWSEGCLSGNGSCSVQVEGGGISFGGGEFGDCNPPMDPVPEFQDDSLPEDAYAVPTPDCSHPDAVNIDKIQLSGNNTLDLNAAYPGAHLICLTSTSKAIQMTGGTLTGVDVTLYLPNSGDIVINGGVVSLSAPGEEPDPTPGVPGVLIYVEPVSSPTTKVDITGNSESSYLGLIYAPTGDIKITGTGDIGPTLNTQIIGYNVTLAGNATIDINFNKTWNYAKPTSVDLEE